MKIEKITNELYNKFMYSTNFLHDIEFKEEDKIYKYSFATRFFLWLILFIFFLIWFIKSPTTHTLYNTYFGRIDIWIEDIIVLGIAISFILFSSLGLRDMLSDNKKKSKNSAVFWVSLLFETAFFSFIFWVQISGYLKTDSQAFFSAIGVYTLWGFATIPYVIWIYRKMNLKNYWMLLKMYYQWVFVWFNWNYNSRDFTHNRTYSLLIGKALKNMDSDIISKVKEDLQDRADRDRTIINIGMMCITIITLWSLFTWISIWGILKLWYGLISSISGYIGASSPLSIAILVVIVILWCILIFVSCLLIRKVNITILEQIELFESKWK